MTHESTLMRYHNYRERLDADDSFHALMRRADGVRPLTIDEFRHFVPDRRHLTKAQVHAYAQYRSRWDSPVGQAHLRTSPTSRPLNFEEWAGRNEDH